MQNKKILFTTDRFEVVDSDGRQGIVPSGLNVVVMPFERDDKGLPKNIGVLREFNPLRSGNYSITLITGGAEGEDPDLLSTAIRETKEESGYDVPDPERWFYLGLLTTSKLVSGECPCFAVDVTTLTPKEKEGDGSEGERKSEFKLVSVKEALQTDDCYVPSVFMRMFRFIFGKEMGEPKEEEKEEQIDPLLKAENLRKRLDIKYLNYDGIIGSAVKEVTAVKVGEGKVNEKKKIEATKKDDVIAAPEIPKTYFIEYYAKEITPDVESIPSEVNGIKIVVTLMDEIPKEEPKKEETK